LYPGILAVVVASKKTVLQVNTERTKYMVMSEDQNSGQNHNIKVDNKTFELVGPFKYLATTLTNQNSFQEEIKIKLKSGNTRYHSVQNLLSSNLIPKNINIKIYRTIILLDVLYGCETWSLTLREK